MSQRRRDIARCAFVFFAVLITALCARLGVPPSQAQVTGGGASGALRFNPACAADNRALKSRGTTQAECSGITVDDSNNLTGIGTVASGAITSTGEILGRGMLSAIGIGEGVHAAPPSGQASVIARGTIGYLRIYDTNGAVSEKSMGWNFSSPTFDLSINDDADTTAVRSNIISISATTFNVGIDQAPHATDALHVNGAFGIEGLFTEYNNVLTDGAGVPPIRDYGTVAAVSADNAVIADYANPAADGLYEVGCWLVVTAWTSGNVGCNLTYTDSIGEASTVPMMGIDTAGNARLTRASVGSLMYHTTTISVDASTSITLNTEITGTATGTFFGHVKQIQ